MKFGALCSCSVYYSRTNVYNRVHKDIFLVDFNALQNIFMTIWGFYGFLPFSVLREKYYFNNEAAIKRQENIYFVTTSQCVTCTWAGEESHYCQGLVTLKCLLLKTHKNH